MAVRNQIDDTYPLYKHTSCAICSVESLPDYNFHFLDKQKCVSGCLNSEVCYTGTAPLEKDIDLLFSKIGLRNSWKYVNNHIQVFGSINEEERSCLSHSLNYPVFADDLTKAPSEEQIRR